MFKYNIKFRIKKNYITIMLMNICINKISDFTLQRGKYNKKR
jgi:hypothetical protein